MAQAVTAQDNNQDNKLIRALYEKWIASWNNKSADQMAEIITDDCNMVGFDGSQMNGKPEIHSTIAEIFKNFPTAEFIYIVQEVRIVATHTAVLRAVVGMVPRGFSDINPAVNAIQTMIAVKANDSWKITMFQNTPAAFHGRPELAEQLTADLRTRLKQMAQN